MKSPEDLAYIKYVLNWENIDWNVKALNIVIRLREHYQKTNKAKYSQCVELINFLTSK